MILVGLPGRRGTLQRIWYYILFKSKGLWINPYTSDYTHKGYLMMTMMIVIIQFFAKLLFSLRGPLFGKKWNATKYGSWVPISVAACSQLRDKLKAHNLCFTFFP